MSAFQFDVIRRGASSVMPGYPNVMGRTSANVPSIQWGPEQPGASVAQFLNMGIPTGSPHIHSHFPSNDFIQHTYIAKPWIEDNAHLYIRDGMLVFVESSKDAQMRQLSNIVALPKLNEILERQYMNYKALIASGDTTVLFPAGVTEVGIENKSVGEDVLNMATQPVLRYQTMYGVLSTWNFLGGVLTVPDAVTGEDMNSFDRADKVINVNVVLGKRVMLANIWGDRRGNTGSKYRRHTNTDPVDVGSRLWLILKRATPGGPFKFFPFVTRKYATPRRADRVYKEMNLETGEVGENDVLGWCIYVGLVTLSATKDAPTGFIDAASGVDTNTGGVVNWYEAHGRLPMIEVQIGI